MEAQGDFTDGHQNSCSSVLTFVDGGEEGVLRQRLHAGCKHAVCSLKAQKWSRTSRRRGKHNQRRSKFRGKG